MVVHGCNAAHVMSCLHCCTAQLRFCTVSVLHNGSARYDVVISRPRLLCVAQLHHGSVGMHAVFPANRGFVSSLIVGSWIGSGIVFEIVRAMYFGLGHDEAAFRSALLGLSAVSFLWAILMLWMAPSRSFTAGDTYRYSNVRFFTESEQQGAARKLQGSVDTTSWGAKGDAETSQRKGQGSTGTQFMVVTHHSSERADSCMSRDSIPTRASSVATSVQSMRKPRQQGDSSAAAHTAAHHKDSNPAKDSIDERGPAKDSAEIEHKGVSDSASSKQLEACKGERDSSLDASHVSQMHTELCSSITLAHDLPMVDTTLARADTANSSSMVQDSLPFAQSPHHSARLEAEHGPNAPPAGHHCGWAWLPVCSRCQRADGTRRTRPAYDRCAFGMQLAEAAMVTVRCTLQCAVFVPLCNHVEMLSAWLFECRWRRIAHLTVKRQMCSYEFWALLAFFPLTVLAQQFYLGSARIQLQELGAEHNGFERALIYVVPGALALRHFACCVSLCAHTCHFTSPLWQLDVPGPSCLNPLSGDVPGTSHPPMLVYRHCAVCAVQRAAAGSPRLWPGADCCQHDDTGGGGRSAHQRASVAGVLTSDFRK